MRELIREAFYFIDSDRDIKLFGHFHYSFDNSKDTVAVICNPIGRDYNHTHRTIRHLSDNLAKSGIPSMRFDYHDSGDSSGDDLSINKLDAWIKEKGL